MSLVPSFFNALHKRIIHVGMFYHFNFPEIAGVIKHLPTSSAKDDSLAVATDTMAVSNLAVAHRVVREK